MDEMSTSHHPRSVTHHASRPPFSAEEIREQRYLSAKQSPGASQPPFRRQRGGRVSEGAKTHLGKALWAATDS